MFDVSLFIVIFPNSTLLIILGLLTVNTLVLEVKRFRGKINIQKPRAPHWERARYFKFTEPWFISPYKGKTNEELCKISEYGKFKDTTDNPLQKIIAKEMYETLTKSRLVGLFHLNPMTSEEQFNAKVSFYNENMFMNQYGRKTIELAMKDTPYETILDFYVSHNMIVFSRDPKVKAMLKICKQFPHLILLGGILEGKLATAAELVEYSKIPNLQAAQINLLQTLSVAENIINNLTRPQVSFVSNLEQIVKQSEEKST